MASLNEVQLASIKNSEIPSPHSKQTPVPVASEIDGTSQQKNVAETKQVTTNTRQDNAPELAPQDNKPQTDSMLLRKNPSDNGHAQAISQELSQTVNSEPVPPTPPTDTNEEAKKAQEIQETLSEEVFQTVSTRSLMNLLRQFPKEEVKRLLLSTDLQDKKLVHIFSDPDKYFQDEEDVEPNAKHPRFEFVVEGYPPMPKDGSEDDADEVSRNYNLLSDDENSDGNELDFPDSDEEFQFIGDEDPDESSPGEASSDDDFDE